MSVEQLKRNRNADEKIVADLQTVDLSGRAFDMIVCWNVLEHLPRPEAAIARMASSLRPDGALVIGVPNLWSTKGLVTKLTPHVCHKWVYHYLLHSHSAGVTPFKTYFRPSVAPRNLERLAAANGLKLVYSETYAGGIEQILPQPLRAILQGWSRIARAVTRGSIDPSLSEHVAVFKKSEVVPQ